MKTFISALIIFALLFSLVLASAFYVRTQMGELLSLARALPEKLEDFEKDVCITEKTLALLNMWQESKRRLAYIMNRDTADKAGEAAQALFAAASAGSAEDFLSARLRFISQAEKISLMFSLSAESIL